MSTIFQPVRSRMMGHRNNILMMKYCITATMKRNLKLFNHSNTIYSSNKKFSTSSYIALVRSTKPPKKLSPLADRLWKRKETSHRVAVVGGGQSFFAMCAPNCVTPLDINVSNHQPLLRSQQDTESSTRCWPSDEAMVSFLPTFQDGFISASRPGLMICSNNFSSIYQRHLESKSMQKILNQAFVGQKQTTRTFSTQTKLSQQKQTAEPSTTPTPPQSDTVDNPTDQLTRQQKLKKAVKEYGSTVMVFHITMSLMSLGAFYLGVSSGMDMVGMMSYLGISDKIQQTAAGASTFVVAYAIHKVFAPVRIGITLSATPLIVRYLRLKGILKPHKTPKPE